MIFRKIFFLFSVPFSFLYFFIITLRNVFYAFNIFRKHKINAKVISVGNITWGGTGKTPVVAFIADILAKKNHRVSILIRGYGNDESELLPKLTDGSGGFQTRHPEERSDEGSPTSERSFVGSSG